MEIIDPVVGTPSPSNNKRSMLVGAVVGGLVLFFVGSAFGWYLRASLIGPALPRLTVAPRSDSLAQISPTVSPAVSGYQDIYLGPSPLLDEVPEGWLEAWGVDPHVSPSPGVPQPSGATTFVGTGGGLDPSKKYCICGCFEKVGEVIKANKPLCRARQIKNCHKAEAEINPNLPAGHADKKQLEAYAKEHLINGNDWDEGIFDKQEGKLCAHLVFKCPTKGYRENSTTKVTGGAPTEGWAICKDFTPAPPAAQPAT
jgi:hypothetical protein